MPVASLVMAQFVVLVATLLVAAESQASDMTDRSMLQGFLSKYMPAGSDASKTPLGDVDKLIAKKFHHEKHRTGPDALSHQQNLVGHGLATDVTQHLDEIGDYGGTAASKMAGKPFAMLHEKHPATPAQHSMALRSAGEKPFINTEDFDMPKIASKEEEKVLQKLVVNDHTRPMALSVIGVGLFTLVAMLGVYIRRKVQPAVVLASRLGSDMSICMAQDLSDNIKDMDSQGQGSTNSCAAAFETSSSCKQNSNKVGWEQFSSGSSPPPTLCYAAPPGKEIDGWAKIAEHVQHLKSLQGYTALVLNADWQPLSFMPLSVWPWQDAVKAAWQGRVDVVSSYDVAVRSASESFPLPSVVVLKKYEVRGGKSPKFGKKLLLLRDGHRCQYCEEKFPPSELTIDHVLPRARGGKSTWENTVACCYSCNLRKSSLLPSDLARAGMRVPKPYQPTAHQLEAAARGLCIHNLARNKVHDSWKVHLGPEFEAATSTAFAELENNVQALPTGATVDADEGAQQGVSSPAFT